MSSPPEKDIFLASRVAAGDQDAADEFDNRFRGRLTRFARSRGVPDHDQSDLVQDVMLAAFQSLRKSGFRAESSMATWMIGILNHKLADYWEHRNLDTRHIARSEDKPESSLHSAIDRVPDARARPEAGIEIRQLLGTLPKAHRAILLLNLVEGWKTDEIAAFLKMPPGTVGRLLWEAKQMLREKRPELKKLSRKGD